MSVVGFQYTMCNARCRKIKETMVENLIIPVDQDPEEWAERYGLRIKKGNCSNCGLELITNIPFAFQGYRGLKSEDHGCGDKYTWKTFKPVKEKEKLEWADLMR